MASAANDTWNGSGTSWQTTTDWTPNTASGGPATTDTAEFNSTFSNQPTLGGTAGNAGAIWATTGLGQNVTIGGSGILSLTGNLTVNGSANTAILLDDAGNHSLTINAPVSTADATSFIVNNTGTLALTGGVTLGANLTLGSNTDNSQGSISINSISAANRTTTISSNGTVSISSLTSTTAGVSFYNAGTANLSSYSSTSGGLTFNNTGTVNLSGTISQGTGDAAQNAGQVFLTGALSGTRYFLTNGTLVIGTGGSVNVAAGGSSQGFQVNGGGLLVDSASNSILDASGSGTVFKIQSGGSAFLGAANAVNDSIPAVTQLGGAANDGSFLILGNAGAIGTGTFEFAGGTLLTTAPMTISTPLAVLNGSIGGTNAINFSGTVATGASGNRVLGVNDSGGVTFSGPITPQTSIDFYGSGPINITGTISGATYGVSYSGTGTMTLDAVNSNTGGTALANNGMLDLNFAATEMTSSTANILSNSVALTSYGSTLYLNGNGSGGTNSQTFASTAFTAGSTVLTLNQNGNTSLALNLGTVTRSAGATLNFSNGSALNTSTTLVSGGFSDDPSGAIIGAWATVGSGTGLQYAALSGSDVVAYAGGASAGTNLSSMTSGTTNYTFSGSEAITASSALAGDTLRNTTGGASISFGSGSSLTLNGFMNAGSGPVTIGASASSGTINIGSNNSGSTKELDITSNTQNITINSVIAGAAGSVAYNGGGVLSLAGANTFTGGFYLDSGTVNVQSNTAFGTTGTLVIAGGNLSSSGLASVAVPETWAENFAFAGSNSNVLTLSGTVTLNQPTVGASAPITLTMNGGSGDTLAVSGVIQGSAYSLDVSGSGGTLALSGANTFSGPLMITNGATVSVNNVDKDVQTTIVGTSGATSFTVGSATGLVAGQYISGTGIPSGATIGSISGTTVTLANSATLSATASGTANFYSANPLGLDNFGASSLVLDNGTLTYTGAAENTDRLFEIGTTTSGSNATINASGSGAINFFNTGDIIYGAVGSSAMAETRTLTLGGTNTGANTLAAFLGNNGYDSSNSGNANVTVIKNGAGEWVLSNGTNSYLGGTIINQGTLENGANNALSQSGSITLGSTGNSATWNLNGYNQTVSSLATAGTAANQTITDSSTASTLTYAGAGSSTYGGALTGTSLGLTVSSGTLLLTDTAAANTYSGATTVNGGQLSVNGGISTHSAFTVNSGGALGGTGSIGGAVTINAGGAINMHGSTSIASPSTPVIGTLTVGSLTINNTSSSSLPSLTFDIQNAGSTDNLDRITDLGALTLGGTNGITINVGNLAGNSTLSTGTYTLLSYASLAGSGSMSNFALSSSTLDGDNISLYNNTSADTLQLVVGPGYATGTYTLTTTAGGSSTARILVSTAGGTGTSTSLTTTLANTGSSSSTPAADSINVTGLGASATGGTVGGGLTTGTTTVADGSSTANTGQTFSSTASGTYTVSGTVTTATGANGTGAAVASGTTTASVVVVNERTFTTPTGTIALGRVMINTAQTGTATVASSGLNGTTATATLTAFSGSGTDGLGLGTSNSLTFNGASATQTDTLTLSGSTSASTGSFSGTFSSTPTDEFGNTLSNVSVAVTGDAVAQRTITNGATTNLGVLHSGATVSTAANAFSSTGTVTTTTSVAVAGGSGTADGNGIALTGSTSSFTGSTASSVNGSTQTLTGTITNATGGTTSGTFSLAAMTLENGGAGLAGEGTYSPVSVAYASYVYTGVGVWNTNGSGSWGTTETTSPANWTANGGIPGITAGFQQTDSASFGGVTTGGTATVTLNGASPYLNAITFNDGAASYDIEQGSGGTVHLDSTSTATVTVSAGNHIIGAPVELDSNAATAVASSDTLTINGNISEASGSHSLALNGAGTTVLSGSNTFSGGTTVGAGTLLVSNSNGSATGSGALTVSPGDTIGGYGTSSGSSFSLSGTGTTTSTRVNVMVGLNSASDTNTSHSLTLLGSGASTIANANLTFNLNALTNTGSTAGTQLIVGGTNITFGSSVKLTLYMQNEPAVVAAFTPYALIIGTGITTDSSGVSGGQYAGLTLGAVTSVASGGTDTVITGSNLQFAFGTTVDQSFYGAHSYLVLYQNSATGADDIEVEVVPEPGTWAMMLGGIAMLVFWQRRKSRQG